MTEPVLMNNWETDGEFRMGKGGAFLDCLICFQFEELKVRMCNIPVIAGFH